MQNFKNISNIVLLSCMIAFTTTGCTTGAFLLGGATAIVAMNKIKN
ncbi:MAG: hypothetical protein P8L77_00440 [Gammaproteobacteria bacterium]|nr:hypothetical protein [Gammaproteobacteria bacterium]